MFTIREGLLAEPELHDGALRGIELSSSNNLTLRFTTLGGQPVVLTLDQLVGLRADNFREGNIVLEVHVLSGAEITPELIKHVYGYGDEDGARLIPKDVQTASAAKWNLVKVDSSYGCELVALGAIDVRIA